MGNVTKIANLQRHFSKLFSGINEVIIDPEQNRVITGMRSKEVETIPFEEPVNTAVTSKVTKWLREVELSMQITLKNIVRSKLELVAKCSSDRKVLEQVMADTPQQPVSLLVQVLFCLECEASLSSGKGLGDVPSKQRKLLEWLSEMAVTAEKLTRLKLQVLITEVVHLRDVAEKLSAEKVNALDDYRWRINLRYYILDKGEKVRKVGALVTTSLKDTNEELVNWPDSVRAEMAQTMFP